MYIPTFSLDYGKYRYIIKTDDQILNSEHAIFFWKAQFELPGGPINHTNTTKLINYHVDCILFAPTESIYISLQELHCDRYNTTCNNYTYRPTIVNYRTN